MVKIQVRSLEKEEVDSIVLKNFTLVDNEDSLKIVHYHRKPFYNGILHYSEPKRLPIGKYYDIYSSGLFVGNLFEFGISYKYRLLPNNFCVYKTSTPTNSTEVALINNRWVCFTNNLKNPTSLVFCGNDSYISLSKL